MMAWAPLLGEGSALLGLICTVGGTTRADVAQKHGHVIATLVTKAPSVVVFAQNETGWVNMPKTMNKDWGEGF